ncbi:CvpA family protein [Aequorivita echinoideorum]|uniref:CvpA family protein n=1 Tax=Aequorivita echinoideorum TaxID=1549647 RepID=A0ABS5S1K0_9FLAO|nr:CvpA family protein [Aequorivita echinoideorum]MBT0607088.1 CvpA family protein [Aequorivita echinoideorum]
MNTLDVIIGVILIIAFFMGFSKGLLRALASLVGIVVGVYCALFFREPVGDYLIRWFDWSADTTSAVAFILTLVLVMILFSILGRILTKVADFAMLGIFNKIFGGIFNVLKYSFLLSVVFMLVNSSESYRILSDTEREDSKLYPTIVAIAPAILPKVMEEINEYETENFDEEKEGLFENPENPSS